VGGFSGTAKKKKHKGIEEATKNASRQWHRGQRQRGGQGQSYHVGKKGEEWKKINAKDRKSSRVKERARGKRNPIQKWGGGTKFKTWWAQGENRGEAARGFRRSGRGEAQTGKFLRWRRGEGAEGAGRRAVT